MGCHGSRLRLGREKRAVTEPGQMCCDGETTPTSEIAIRLVNILFGFVLATSATRVANPLGSEAGSLGSWQRQKHSLSWSVNYRFQVSLRCFRMDDTTVSSPFQAIFTYRSTCTGCQVPTLSPVSSSEQRQYQEMLILVRITRFGWSISTTLLSLTSRAIADPSYVRCQALHPGTVVEEA